MVCVGRNVRTEFHASIASVEHVRTFTLFTTGRRFELAEKCSLRCAFLVCSNLRCPSSLFAVASTRYALLTGLLRENDVRTEI
ncbi:hypothetical protein C443_14652 [Haloarcula argentinensis DSM 12282]|nr:hypothetical protein C443_14652 [Haloarcula argentinensis DSM 12282]